MQWTLFGLPMYTVRAARPAAGSAAAAAPARRRCRRRKASVAPWSTAAKRSSLASLPPFLTRLDLQFDFSAAGVYRRVHSSPAGDGVPSTRDELGPGESCPSDPNGGGCYFTLNGLATGQADLPVQPYFVYSSRLSGTSQHGVLWKGGTFREETPLAAAARRAPVEQLRKLRDTSAPCPSTSFPVSGRPASCPAKASEAAGCPPTDLELNQLVLPTGETVKGAGGELTRERLELTVDLEIFYFNDTTDSATNCDRQGAGLGDQRCPHHPRHGRRTWRSSTDDRFRSLAGGGGGSSDGTLDAQDRGAGGCPSSSPSMAGDGRWHGSYEAGGAGRRSSISSRRSTGAATFPGPLRIPRRCAGGPRADERHPRRPAAGPSVASIVAGPGRPRACDDRLFGSGTARRTARLQHPGVPSGHRRGRGHRRAGSPSPARCPTASPSSDRSERG